MNKKGQIGQIISSFPVLFLVIFLMLIFVLLSGFFKFTTSNGEEIAKLDETLNSKILLELFLGDYITLDGKEIKVEELIRKIDPTFNVRKTDYLNFNKIILEKFKKDYSCDGKNFLGVGREADISSLPGKYDLILFIDFPESEDILDSPRSGTDEFYSDKLGKGLWKKSFGEDTDSLSPSYKKSIVYVKENVKC
ncbi:TPA: hypothetical protein EYQ19_02030 [Candidatus Pacearchaeota archaeon]|jgi:hypothetical protein|nr:hypothetical protein [Candidatus Pacearchaeota archaeon]